jgi:hypothetical protein
MRVIRLSSAPAGLAFLLLVGCATFRDSAIDQAAGLPASSLMRDIKETADDDEEQRQDERAEELSSEYEEFLRSREAVDASQETAEQSVIIKRSPGQEE